MSDFEGVPSAYDLVSAVGNMEHKAIVGGLMFQHPETSYSYADLGRLVADAINTHPLDKGQQNHLAYPRDSFAPIASVVRQDYCSARGRIVEAYRATSFGATAGKAVVGAVLEWSDAHPDLQIETLLGVTASTGQTRASENRLQIFKEITTHGFLTLTGSRFADLQSSINGLIADGIAERHSSRDQFKGFVFEIQYDPRSERIMGKPGKTKTVIRDVVGTLFEQGVREIDFQDLIVKISERYPDIDIVEIRDAIRDAKYCGGEVRSHFVYGLKPKVANPFTTNNQSILHLKDEYAQPVADLVTVIKDATEGHPERWQQTAESILADKSKTTELYYKGKDNIRTLAHRIGKDGVLLMILDQLSAIPSPLTVQAVQNAVRLDGYFGRKISMSHQATYMHLKTLAKEGFLIEEPTDELDLTNQRQTRYKLVA